ncbi:MAG: hypothetical protein AAB614_02385 [Patescibacteria group bacterium]
MTNEDAIKKIARILRADKAVVTNVCARMEDVTGSKNVPQRIMEENDILVSNVLTTLGVRRDAYHFEVYNALIGHIKSNDEKIFKLLREPRCIDFEGCKTLLNFAQEISGVPEGFFMKRKKAEELLRNQPPLNIISALGYSSINELLEKEELYQVFSALRFLENMDWLNNVFFAQYKNLTVDDFEFRPIEVKVLDEKWLKAAEKFLKKKYHNVSHLKELGVIFVIPLELNVPGETMRLFTLILHYLNEVTFYSRLFQKYSQKPEAFAEMLISSLRGDVLDRRFPSGKVADWMIVQRYLAKDDEYDWRLFEPHVNPEALHWSKAEQNVASFNDRFPETKLGFWKDLDHAGDFFKTESGVDNLVSLNLIDTVMSLVMDKEMIKYLYHHQEAMWNKLFICYVGGQEKMEEMLIDNFTKGYISF